jgi:hypothetical protein
MIDKIKRHSQLKPFIVSTCDENNILVNIADTIPPGNYLVLKVDKYYNSLKLGKTPPSIDCLIPLKCSDSDFVIYLIELKNIKSPKGFKPDNIYKKFKVTIEDFMIARFNDIFLDNSYQIKDMRLYFVSNPYRQREISHRREGTKMDALLSRRPFSFRGILCQLKHILPNPIIENC